VVQENAARTDGEHIRRTASPHARDGEPE
jgi:hypothetical protein